MGYAIEVSSDRQYIIIALTGDLTREAGEESRRASADLGRELGINCFLIDATEARNIARPLENVHFAEGEDSSVYDPSVCFAVVVDPGDRSHDFVVAYAQTQGIDTTLFHSREKAVAHLLAAARRLNVGASDPDGSRGEEQGP